MSFFCVSEVKAQTVYHHPGRPRSVGVRSLPTFSECCPTTRHLYTQCRVCSVYFGTTGGRERRTTGTTGEWDRRTTVERGRMTSYNTQERHKRTSHITEERSRRKISSPGKYYKVNPS